MDHASAPSVIERTLAFALEDPERLFARVALDCDEAIVGPRRFRRTSAGWLLTIPRPALARVEYRLIVTARDGSTAVICDPANPERVQTAFGDRSVVLMPGYETPSWLHTSAPPGRTRKLTHKDRSIGEIPIQVWSPARLRAADPAPLLVVHDGPEYASLARLTTYAAVQVSTGALPPFRMALMQPVHRDEWYAANDDYLRAEIDAVDSVVRRIPTDRRLVAMGASLGGLSALLLAMRAPQRFSGVFAQSGSFFQKAHDAQESGYPHFDQIAAAVERIGSTTAAEPLDVTLTCGELEENKANNEAMAESLANLGCTVDLTMVPDLHNYTAWRDALDPSLTALLRRAWDTPG